MVKSGYLLVAAAMVGAVVVAGDAQAQMRTRKGEYYEGIQRKPYGHYFLIRPSEEGQPAYQQRPHDRPAKGKSDRSRKSYAQ